MRVILDTKRLDRIARETPSRANEILQKLAEDTETDIKTSFNAQQPAPVGEPPGVDTGNLRSSIVARPDGENWIVSDGVPYGVHLEYGTSRMGARPWMLPAVRRAVLRAPDELMRIVED